MADETSRILLSQIRKGKSIPGCSLDTVVPGFIQGEFGDKIRAIEDAGERVKYQKDLTDYYLSGNGKKVLEGIIESMEYYYNIADTVINQVNITAASMSAMNLIPSTLVAGSATGVANPAWVTPHNKFLKGSLTTQLLFGKDALGSLIERAILIHFDISASATSLASIATIAETTINAIV